MVDYDYSKYTYKISGEIFAHIKHLLVIEFKRLFIHLHLLEDTKSKMLNRASAVFCHTVHECMYIYVESTRIRFVGSESFSFS